jgi:hypothetical protein
VYFSLFTSEISLSTEVGWIAVSQSTVEHIISNLDDGLCDRAMGLMDDSHILFLN